MLERDEGRLSIPKTPRPGQGQSGIAGLVPAPDTKLHLWVLCCAVRGASLCPTGPRGLTVQSIAPSRGQPRDQPPPPLPLEPLLHLLALSPEKGRINPFWGNLLYLQGSRPNETGEAIPTHNLAACHLSGSKQGQPWPRTFSTRAQQAPHPPKPATMPESPGM